MIYKDRAGFVDFLRSGGYVHPVCLDDRTWCGVLPLLFHGSLKGGRIGDFIGVDHTFCYPSVADALVGMTEWIARDCEGQPVGWHKQLGRDFNVDGPLALLPSSPKFAQFTSSATDRR